MSNMDFETPSDIVSPEALSLGTRPPASKPDISGLPDAIVGGIPQFTEGDKIVIERYSSFLAGKPYLDTKTYVILRHDEFTGRLHLLDIASDGNAIMNWREGLRFGTVFKLPMKGAPLPGKSGKRGRPRKNPLPPPPPDGTPPPKKKGRGRPPGVKNRPAEVIRAEKAAKRALRVQKAARRKGASR